MALKFQDLSLQITSVGPDGLQVQIRSSASEDTVRASFHLPLERQDLDRFRRAFHSIAAAASHRGSIDWLFRALAPNQPSEKDFRESLDAKKIGADLLEALFPTSKARELLGTHLSRIRPGQGLRLNLHLDLTDPAVAWLAGLPWELIYHHRSFVLLEPLYSLVRRLEQSASPRAGIRRPLQILVVSSDLRDSARVIDVAGEWRKLSAAWRESPSVKLTHLERPSLEELEDKLHAETFHALHFIGHGIVQESGITCIALQRDGHAEYVTGEILADLLKGHLSVHLVVLNACWTGHPVLSEQLDPFSAMTSALLAAGIPAVVAMQSWITDKAALAFSKGFYSGLAAGESIDSAMTRGRRAMRFQNLRSFEWATPVLYMRRQGERFLGLEKPSGRKESRRLLLNTRKPLAKVTTAEALSLLEPISAFLQILPTDLKLVRRKQTPNEIFLELPPASAERLLAAWKSGDRKLIRGLAALKVQGIDGQPKGTPRKLAATALLTLTLMMTSLLRSDHPSPSPCRDVPITRIELDLPTGPRLLNLDGKRITRVTAADLRRVQYLTGRAVLENNSGCPCLWEGDTGQELTKQKISVSPDNCAFQMKLPETYSRINLRLFLGATDHLFTVKLP